MTAWALAPAGRGPRHPGPWRQVGQLFALRWSTLTTGSRVLTTLALTVLLGALPAVILFGAFAEPRLGTARAVEAVELAPGMLLVLAVGLLVSAVASSGGREIVPRQQLVGYPVSPAAEHLASLLLAPANLAWTAQVLGAGVLVGLHARDAASDAVSWQAVLAAGSLLFAVYVAALTSLAQVLAWLVEFVRTLRGGKWVVRGCFAGLTVLAVTMLREDVLVALLDQAPTAVLTAQVEAFADGRAGGLTLAVVLLAGFTVLTGMFGAWVYRLVVARPPRDQSRSETTDHRPRGLPAVDAPAALLRVWRRQDWACVLRSVPLRRGLLVLLIAPTVGVLLARVAWPDLTLFTSVVGAGAGLLFGVNMFALDGEGAIWRENLPVSPRLWLWSRTLVLTEVVLGTATLTTLAATVSARGEMTATTLLVAVLAVPTVTAQVVSRCVAWSVDSPERVELRTTRDSPLSPGRMMTASARLMGATIGVAIVLAVLARIDRPWLVVPALLPFWAFSAWRLWSAARRWDSHEVRAVVVQTVARG